MQNWIGVGIWIVMGAAVGLAMKVIVKRPEETSGHTVVLAALGSFAACIGGMLGVGHLPYVRAPGDQPGRHGRRLRLRRPLTFIYRWGVRGLI